MWVMINLNTNRILAWEIKQAKSFLQRMKGVFSSGLPFGSALFIHRCRMVNTLFMNQAVDVLYVNECQQIVGLEQNVQPGSLVRKFRQSVSVIKLPAGTILRTETQVGQAIYLKKIEQDRNIS